MSKKVQDIIKNHKKLLLVHGFSLGLLLLGFVICRYAVFGTIHQMKDWPFLLLFVGIAVLLLSLFARKQNLPLFTALGYSLGFWLGALFHTEGVDPGGGKTDNLWIIWTAVFLGCILAGSILEVVMKWRKLLKK